MIRRASTFDPNKNPQPLASASNYDPAQDLSQLNPIPTSYLIYQTGSTVNALRGPGLPAVKPDSDAATVIQNAVNSLPNGGSICLKGGLYVINSAITWASNVRMFGMDGFVTPFQNYAGPAPSNIPVLQTNFTNHNAGIIQASAQVLDGCAFENFAIDMNGKDTQGIRFISGGSSGGTQGSLKFKSLSIYNTPLSTGNYGIVIGSNWWNPIFYDCVFENGTSSTNNGGSIYFQNSGSFIYAEQCQDYSNLGMHLDCFNAVLRDCVHQRIDFGGTNSNSELLIDGGSFTNGFSSTPITITNQAAKVGLVRLLDCVIFMQTNVGNFITTGSKNIGRLDVQGCEISLNKAGTNWVDTPANILYTTGKANIMFLNGFTLGNSPFFNTALIVQGTTGLAIEVIPVGFAATTPAVPATTVDQQNTNPYPVRIYFLTSGTVTAIKITDANGTAQTITTAVTALDTEITLDPGAKIALTYTGAPTWKWYGA